MVREIYTSKLEELAEKIWKEFGVSVWFAEIIGKRWSYVAGSVSSEILPSLRFKINENLGLVIECDSEELATKIFNYVKSILNNDVL